MASARYCPSCMRYWPHQKDFVKCPECEDPTSVRQTPDDQIVEADEAKRILNQFNFERYYEKRAADPNWVAEQDARAAETEQRLAQERARLEEFDRIVEALKYTDEEREVIRKLEKQLADQEASGRNG